VITAVGALLGSAKKITMTEAGFLGLQQAVLLKFPAVKRLRDSIFGLGSPSHPSSAAFPHVSHDRCQSSGLFCA
jgi:hypothetical protein